ncbi:hypothetical protein SAMN03097699_0933 [Flavobacteriaceae bacterium MAR_2010_188]|nr:hypothetical protein SAMN03097699_0933 [Flavobacteriaceae bacterium MAR_2010_188]
MFYYKASKKPKLEVSISKSYSEADIQRLFLFIESLIDNPNMHVVFKVNPSTKEQFTAMFEKNNLSSIYNYSIQ